MLYTLSHLDALLFYIESYSHGTQSPCFADPQKETCRWPNMSFSSLESDVERDQPGPPNVSDDGRGPQTADTASTMEFLGKELMFSLNCILFIVSHLAHFSLSLSLCSRNDRKACL